MHFGNERVYYLKIKSPPFREDLGGHEESRNPYSL
jgi:hypothetical protein